MLVYEKNYCYKVICWLLLSSILSSIFEGKFHANKIVHILLYSPDPDKTFHLACFILKFADV
jgi:hypothetical protein